MKCKLYRGLGKLSTIIYTFLVFKFFLKLYVWGSAGGRDENESHYRPRMRIILICIRIHANKKIKGRPRRCLTGKKRGDPGGAWLCRKVIRTRILMRNRYWTKLHIVVKSYPYQRGVNYVCSR